MKLTDFSYHLKLFKSYNFEDPQGRSPFEIMDQTCSSLCDFTLIYNYFPMIDDFFNSLLWKKYGFSQIGWIRIKDTLLFFFPLLSWRFTRRKIFAINIPIILEGKLIVYSFETKNGDSEEKFLAIIEGQDFKSRDSHSLDFTPMKCSFSEFGFFDFIKENLFLTDFWILIKMIQDKRICLHEKKSLFTGEKGEQR